MQIVVTVFTSEGYVGALGTTRSLVGCTPVMTAEMVDPIVATDGGVAIPACWVTELVALAAKIGDVV